MKCLKREGPIAIIKETLKTKGVVGLYSGCGALVIGNAAKAGVRFVTYDHLKSLLADSEVGLISKTAMYLSHVRRREKSVPLAVCLVCHLPQALESLAYNPHFQLDWVQV